MGAVNPAGYEEVRHQLLSPLLPETEESVCDWVEENVYIPTGEITGRMQLRMIPYGREILERYADKTTRHLVECFATQSAKTTILICGMLYKVARDAKDAAWVMGNADQAKEFNKERFMPFVNACEPVYDLVPRTSKGAVNKHLWGFKNQHYRSMVLNFIGAGSAINLASRPRGFVVLDECDKYYSEIKFDAGTIPLIEERMKTFNFPLCVKASSPTTAQRMIWQEFLKTDQRRYWVPCPRCGESILLKMRIDSEKHGQCGLRWWHENEEEAMTDGVWDYEKVRALAFYKCPCCGGMIHNFEREDMLQEGVWKPENLRAERGRYGYHLNSIYSILGNETSLGNIAIKFLMAKGDRSNLQNFINGWLAEPWDISQIYEQKEVNLEVYKPLEIPTEATALMAIDCQVGHYWVLIRKFAPPTKEFPYGQSWLLFADRVDTEEEIVELQKLYGVEGQNVTADMAKKPNQVGRMILAHDWRGIWGSNTKHFFHPGPGGTRVQRPFSVVQFRDPMLGTAWEARTLKRVMYVLFSKEAALDMVSSLRFTKPTIWHITANCSPRYGRQLNSMVKRQQTSKRTGRLELMWISLYAEDHLLDCECHTTIRAMQLGLMALPPESEEQNVIEK